MTGSALIYLPTDEARAIKWRDGRVKYGPEFVGDPLEELDSELLDAMNYAEEAEGRGIKMGSIPARLRALREDVQFVARRPRE